MSRESRQEEGDGSWSQSSFSKKWQENTSSPTKVLIVRLLQLEALLGVNKGRFLTAKSKRSSGQTTFQKHQTGRTYMKLLTLTNKLPELRKTKVKHYTENSTAVFSKLKPISVTEMVTICWDWSTEKNIWLLCKTWDQQSSARKQQNGSVVTIGKKQCLVNWEGLLQCPSLQNRRVGYGKPCGRSITVWPRRPYVYHMNKSKQHWL